ncbi:cysteine-rich repeat secretory protein 38-like [Glycine soja]|uniref:cysteine-rich repeat secretory protein 38-like n=1 Tax=Glycine soja TaxID=3848 RepID=UPI001038A43A|nr:cysteine-rich repeat secretory protein 38-like [Glycine soja]
MLSIFRSLFPSKEAILLVPYFVSDPSPYGANLNQLFELLHTKVPPTGFGHATKKLQERCPPKKKGTIVWYDYCLIKYSNEYFFGEIDEKNKFYMVNIYDVDDPATFGDKVNELLSGLSYTASQIPMLYAISDLPNYCDGKQGARVVGGSCYVRYELYPIVEAP